MRAWLATSFISGETLVRVKGRSDLSISSITDLGLTNRNGRVKITLNGEYDDIDVDAAGNVPMDVQYLLSDVTVSMTLVHVDRAVLDVCFLEAMAGGGAIPAGAAAPVGTLPRAGTRLGNGVPRFSPNGTAGPNGNLTTGNHFIGLNLTSPVQNKPWRFFYAYLLTPAHELGTRRSEFDLQWRVLPYSQDPYSAAAPYTNTGLGYQGFPLWDYGQDA